MLGTEKQKSKLSNDTETLLATVSHDLKNPIVSVLLALELLNNPKTSPLNDFQKEILDNITNSLKYMRNLVVDILDSYRLDNHKYQMNKVRVNFIDFVQSAIEDSKYILSDKNQSLKFIVSIKNVFIDIDVLEMKRVINNLISNASKYSPQYSKITVRVFEKNNFKCFSIENECFADIESTNIFEKFVTSNDNTNLIATGLGLYIVKEIIIAHGGRIFIERNAKNSVRLTFLIP